MLRVCSWSELGSIHTVWESVVDPTKRGMASREHLVPGLPIGLKFIGEEISMSNGEEHLVPPPPPFVLKIIREEK